MNCRSVGVFSIALCGAFFLSAGIDGFYHSAGNLTLTDTPAAMRILGESRNIASNLVFLQADRYYHRGVGHPDEHDHGGIGDEMIKEDEHVQDRDESNHAVGKFLDPLVRISTGLEINDHDHMGTEDLEEIVPWLYYAHKIDPNNTDAYTLTAYYLADRFDKVDEAMALLKSGMVNNPDSWEICAEMGSIQYNIKHDYKSAVRFLSRAVVLMNKGSYDRFDARKVLTPLAYSYLELGKKRAAFKVLEQLVILFPESSLLSLKSKELRDEIEASESQKDSFPKS